MATKKKVSGLEAHVGYWLRYVSNHVSHGFKEKVEGRGVTVAEWVVMRALYEEKDGLNPSEVARRLGMTRGAISKLAERLVVKGLTACDVQTDDRRYQTLRLTVAGTALVPMLAKLADENDAEFFAALSDSERKGLVELLKRIVRERGLGHVPVD
jgi:DNA-binding MarR family transcriptional regulator